MSNIDTKTAQIKNKRYEISPDLAEIATKILGEKMLDIRPARVRYVLVYPNIDKTTAGRCMVANAMVTLMGDCDFVIQMSGDLWDALPVDLQNILMYHELLHINCVQHPKTGDWKFNIRDHDINEFREVIEEHGIDWLAEVKDVFITSGGFDPEEVDILSI